MQLEIHSRHFTLGDDMKEKIVGKLENLKRYSPSDPVAVRMSLSQEGGRFVGDLTFNIKQHSCHSKVEHVEPDGAAFLAIESVERQLRRHKDRVKDHRGRSVDGGLGVVMGEETLDNEGSAVVDDIFELRDLKLEEAKTAYAESQNPFFVFRNADSSEVNVLYRRQDGEYVVMTPESKE